MDLEGLTFIDKTGKEVFSIPFKCSNPRSLNDYPSLASNSFCSEGYCLFNESKEDKGKFQNFVHIYTTSGTFVKTIAQAMALSNFQGGQALIHSDSLRKKQRFGYINTQGNVIKWVDSPLPQFKYGLRASDEHTLTPFFLNRKGEVVATTGKEEAVTYLKSILPDGVLMFRYLVDGNYGTISRVLDSTGKEMPMSADMKKEVLTYVGDGLFVRKDAQGKCSFVNIKGKKIVPIDFIWTEDSKYQDGLALVNKWEEVPIPKRIVKQIINLKGKVVLEKKVAPVMFGNTIEVMFYGDLMRIDNTFYNRQGKLIFKVPTSGFSVNDLRTYLAYPPESILYAELDCYDVENERYVKLADYPNFTKFNPKKLDFESGILHEFPKEILHMTNLEELDLSFQDIKEIPTEISRLVNLKILKLSHNEIKTLPESIISMPNLRTIEMDNNPYKHNLQIPSNIELKLDDGVIMMSEGVMTDSDGKTYSDEELKAKEEEDRRKREEAYRVPDDVPVLSDKGANLILWVLQNPPKRDEAAIERESDEIDELNKERQNEGRGWRRKDGKMYPISLKRRKEIYQMLKQEEEKLREKRKITPPTGNYLPVDDAVFYSYYFEKIGKRNNLVIERVVRKEFNSMEILKEKLPTAKAIKGFNLVRMVEEQIQQNLPEGTIKANIRTFLEKEFENLH